MALMGAEWLQTGRNIPADGTIHRVRYETGTRSSKEHLRDLNSVLTTLLGLVDIARDAVRVSVYSPGRKDGVPVAVRVRESLTFRIQPDTKR